MRDGSSPTVSVVVPTRDRPELLRRAVQQVLDQRYPGEIECVVVFDQSDPAEVPVELAEGRRLRTVRNQRAPGLAGARNAGVLASTGELVAFCDDDDEWLAGKVAAHVGPTAAPQRLRPLPRWPLLALYLGFPLWWVLGLGALIWPLLTLTMLLALAVRGHVRVPRGFGLWFGFLVWMLGSGLQLDSGARVVGWAYRAALYLSATVVFLYVYNSSRERLPARTLTLLLAGFWMFVVIGGYLGLLLPHGSFATPVEHLMSPDLLRNGFVHDLVHPAFAQTAGANLGVAPRP